MRGRSDLTPDLLKVPPGRITTMISDGKVPICIVGMGHIGLPLALLLVDQGAKVTGCDKDHAFLDELRAGRSPIVEHSKNLFPSSQVLPFNCPNCGVRILKVDKETFCPSCMKSADVSSGSVKLSVRLHKVRMEGDASHEMGRLLKAALSSNRLELTSDTAEAVSRSRIVIITVGTPIDERRRPENSALVAASNDIGRGLKRGSLVILRSTVSPGTTEGLVGSMLSKVSGLRPGIDFGLAHVPETTIEGLALFELRTLPKVIGGVNAGSARAAAALFALFKTPTYEFDEPKTTETAKLFLNIYRDVNIALANELALACEALGIDVMKVIEATRADPKTNMLTPGPGVGGFCLPKDPYYLIGPASEKGFSPDLLSAARRVNDSMPGHVFELTQDAFDEASLRLSGSTVAVIGVAFKGNTADTRESPSLAVISRLKEAGAKVVVHDPLVMPDDRRLKALDVRRKGSVKGAVQGSTAVVILTDHLEYRGLTGASLKRMSPGLKIVVDARHILDPSEVASAGLVYRGVGQRSPT